MTNTPFGLSLHSCMKPVQLCQHQVVTTAPCQTEPSPVKMHTHGPCMRRAGPSTTPIIRPQSPCSTLLNTNMMRLYTHLSASSRPSPLCGCGTPTARSRPQNKQMRWITFVSIGLRHQGSFVRLFQGLSWYQASRPWCFSKTSPLPRLSSVWHPEAPTDTATVRINTSQQVIWLLSGKPAYNTGEFNAAC